MGQIVPTVPSTLASCKWNHPHLSMVPAMFAKILPLWNHMTVYSHKQCYCAGGSRHIWQANLEYGPLVLKCIQVIHTQKYHSASCTYPWVCSSLLMHTLTTHFEMDIGWFGPSYSGIASDCICTGISISHHLSTLFLTYITSKIKTLFSTLFLLLYNQYQGLPGMHCQQVIYKLIWPF